VRACRGKREGEAGAGERHRDNPRLSLSRARARGGARASSAPRRRPDRLIITVPRTNSAPLPEPKKPAGEASPIGRGVARVGGFARRRRRRRSTKPNLTPPPPSCNPSQQSSSHNRPPRPLRSRDRHLRRRNIGAPLDSPVRRGQDGRRRLLVLGLLHALQRVGPQDKGAAGDLRGRGLGRGGWRRGAPSLRKEERRKTEGCAAARRPPLGR
jgi:hypothetical protein